MSYFSGVYQINLRVRNIKRACEWYKQILGLHVEKDFGRTVVLGFAGFNHTNICLIELPEGEEVQTQINGTHPVITIAEDQVEHCRDFLEKSNVEIIQGSRKGHFKFSDPDGNLLEAYQPGLYEAARFSNLR